MKLTQLTPRVWISPFDDDRDRPSLGYVRGDRMSLAVDAGHSQAHVEEFYAALAAEGLPLPDLTVLTHWHWDHTFGIHAVHGLTAAGERTQAHLREVLDRWPEQGEAYYKAMEPHLALEYGDRPILVRAADLTFSRELSVDLGGAAARCFPLISPHTDDSTFVLLPREGILFVGDAICGEYPTWQVDPDRRARQLLALEKLEFRTAVGGHWQVFTREGLFTALREGTV